MNLPSSYSNAIQHTQRKTGHDIARRKQPETRWTWSRKNCAHIQIHMKTHIHIIMQYETHQCIPWMTHAKLHTFFLKCNTRCGLRLFQCRLRFVGAATWNFYFRWFCIISAYDNLALCTYFGIDALKTKKKAYMYADVHLLNFYTYVCTYDSYILFFLWLNTYIDANQFYIWMYDYVHFFL